MLVMIDIILFLIWPFYLKAAKNYILYCNWNWFLVQTKSTAVDSKEFPFIQLAGRNVLQMWKNYAMLRFC